MKVLVVAHRLELGGTQTNAVELAARVRDRHGVNVTLAAAGGPSEALARERGIDLRLIPDASRHPSRARVSALTALTRELNPDLVHVWDWPQCFDAYPGSHLLYRRPLLCTVMSMVVPRFIPRHLPTTFGTEELAESARVSRQGVVHLLEPPVDLKHNAPGTAGGPEFRDQWGLHSDDCVVVMVTRLENWLKLEGLLRAIDAIGALAGGSQLRLVIVGEGAARPRPGEGRCPERRAGAGGRDPDRRAGRPASRLRRRGPDARDGRVGTANSRVREATRRRLGERGFSRVLDETTLPLFLHQGWYGLGDGTPDDLTGQIDASRTIPTRADLGKWGRTVVEEHFSLDDAADRLVGWYTQTVQRRQPLWRDLVEGGRTAAFLVAQGVRDQLRRRRWHAHTLPATNEKETP